MKPIARTALIGSIATVVGVLTGTCATAQEESTSVGGYGEIQYVDPEGGVRGTVDVPRFIIFLEHTFNAEVLFVSEIEIEHTKIEGGADGGEVAIEQAYLQFRIGEKTDLRAGLVLVPAGIINETHEPPTFLSVRRPLFDRVVVPTTWREIGVGISGGVPWVEGLQYRAYLTSGLNSDGFSPSNGIRGGRYAGALAPVNNLALSGRMEYVDEGIKIGGWVYHGGSSNNNVELGTGMFDAAVTGYGLDARYTLGDVSLRGVIAGFAISAADTINAIRLRDTTGPAIGSAIGGGYLEVAYNMMPMLDQSSGAQILPFIRFESLNTQASMPDGFVASKANDRMIVTAGLAVKPTYNTVVKADWTMNNDGTDANVPGALSVGVGYNF